MAAIASITLVQRDGLVSPWFAMLLTFCVLFAITYVLAYVAIVRFKVPRWLR